MEMHVGLGKYHFILLFFYTCVITYIYRTKQARHFERVLVMLNLSFVMLPKQNELSSGRVSETGCAPQGLHSNET